MAWTAKRVDAWLIAAVDVLERLPDLETRYLRNALRSRFPDVIETTASAFAAALGALQADGALPGVKVRPAAPSAQEIDAMEAVLLGIPKPSLGLAGETPWLNWLGRKRRRRVWRRVTGMPWTSIAGGEDRSERTCQRWYREALEHIADELTTENG